MTENEIPDCPGPDPDPRPPRFGIPAGAWDAHAHVFGPAAKYPYAPKRGYTPPDAPPAEIDRLHQALGIDCGILTQPSVYGTDNRAMLDAIARSNGRLMGVAAVDGAVTDAALTRLHDQGIRGIRVNMVDKGGMPFASISEFVEFAARLKPMGWHLELLIHVSEFPDLTKTLGGLPVDFVVGHLGYMKTTEGVDNPGFRELLALMKDGRAWTKLTGTYRITQRDAPPYDDVPPLAAALAEAAPDRLLWGSDWPHPWHYKTMPNDGYLLDQLADWRFDETLIHKILVDNPVRLLGE